MSSGTLLLFKYLFEIFRLYLIWYFTSTLFHELGHYITANSYMKTNGTLLLRWFWDVKNLNINIKGLKIRFRKLKGSKGKAYIENDFICYDAQQIKKIASAGRNYQMCYGLFLNALWFILYIKANNLNTYDYIMVTFIFFILLLYYWIYCSHLLASMDKKSNSLWPDYRICKNPEGYLEYCKIREDSYQNILKKYDIK